MHKLMIGAGLVAAVVVLAGTAEAQDAPYCREYQQKVTVGGKVKESWGTACMQPDGSWQKMDNSEQDNVAAAVAEDIQVTQYAEPVVVQQVVYAEPVYYEPVVYPSWSVSFGSSDWDHRGWHGRHGWHHGGHRWH